MKKTINIDGKEIWFSFIAGEVMSATKHSTTEIFGSGGGGSIDTSLYNSLGPRVHGKMKDIEISSKTNTATELWIKGSDDKETRIVMQNTDIPCRQGHRVAFVTAGKNSTYYISLFINFNARTTTHLIKKENLLDLLEIRDTPAETKLSGTTKSITTAVAVSAAGITTASLTNSIEFNIIGIVAGICIGFMMLGRKEIPRPQSYVANTDIFATEYEEAVTWAMSNLYDPANADLRYLTAQPKILQAIEGQNESGILDLK
ncbi:hypothetical protein FVW20_17950 [Desulfovibrio oxamicus]|uniref:Uncharacterized protein n=1 Tax=Nitratidesulfovibrio oxamicus TaxID=32016 RepID=A0ABS0J8P9_9BACT|nr:hypothetical protein [Nitratidesulfovibrio oxamicus]MBG3878829.1 hypothetical protein [Nitratidesulfovibrio oxamicus]